MKRQHDMTMDDPNGVSTILCCSCGIPMVPNQTMRCAQCLKAEVSIIAGISRQVVLPRCRNCGRYSKPPWTKCEPESRELLGMCLKKIKGIHKDARLVDASFIWTEEHSMRIKVKITVQKEVANSTVLQQTMVVEFQVVNQQCEDCQKSFTPHTWNAIVQVRQKVTHRRTFCFLEQLILKNDAHDKVLSLKESRDGLDFHFAQRSHAQRFADFVSSCVPANLKNSKKLISHDGSNNIYSYKYTILMELCPICVDDVVHVPRGHSAQLSGAAPLMLCHKVSNAVRLVDPVTLRSYDIPGTEYFKRPLVPICSRKHFTEFVVLDVNLVEVQEAGTPAKHRLAGRGKMALADIEVARAEDFGINDERLIVRSHLGNVVKPGNRVYGYDLRAVNVSGFDCGAIENQNIDVILVRKLFGSRKKQRAWELRRLVRETDEGVERINDENDMEAMCEDLEENPELRKGVNMYMKPAKPERQTASVKNNVDVHEEGKNENDNNDENDEDSPEVPLAELLEGLELCDGDAPLPL